MRIKVTSVMVENQEHARLERLGVLFRMSPTSMGPVTIAIFDDTCSNLTWIYQV